MCDECLNNICLYIDDMLDHDEKRKFEEHINCCEECNEAYNEILQLTIELNNIEHVDVPCDLHENIMREINKIHSDDKKIIKLDFYKKTLFTVASVIGFALILTPAVSGVTYGVPKTTVMAEDLNLVDHIRVFGNPNYVYDEISVSVKSDEITNTFNQLEMLAYDYGDLISESDLGNVATLTAKVPKDVAHLFVSDIVDTFDNVRYSSSKSILNQDIKNINNEIENNKQNGMDENDDEFLKLIQTKDLLIEKCSYVYINVTIHN